MRARPALLAAATACGALAIAGVANAQILATPCPGDVHRCGKADIRFDQTDAALPFEFDVDTGWTPQGSPLQVRITAGLWAHTRVGLTGTLVTSWPDAFVLQAPGKPEDGGLFAFHYGAEFEAQGQIDISVLGQDITWTGDLPYLPAFDLEVEDSKLFSAWGYDPGVSLSSETMPQRIATVSIGDLLGASIPGVDGGFELDVAVQLQANYRTDRIVIDGQDGQAVAGGPITSETGASSSVYDGGPHVDYEVHPEGTVNYQGVIHMIPAFYISFLGSNFSIPIADIPIPVSLGDTPWNFDPVSVRVPLPDLKVTEHEINFGVVEVGKTATRAYHAKNAGELSAHAALWLDGHATGEGAAFVLDADTLDVDPSGDGQGAIHFTPGRAGDFDVDLTFETNDPDEPVQVLHLHGGATKPADMHPEPPPAENDDTGGVVDENGGCGCRAAGEDRGAAPPAAFGLALLGAIVARRRRRPPIR